MHLVLLLFGESLRVELVRIREIVRVVLHGQHRNVDERSFLDLEAVLEGEVGGAFPV